MRPIQTFFLNDLFLFYLNGFVIMDNLLVQ